MLRSLPTTARRARIPSRSSRQKRCSAPNTSTGCATAIRFRTVCAKAWLMPYDPSSAALTVPLRPGLAPWPWFSARSGLTNGFNRGDLGDWDGTVLWARLSGGWGTCSTSAPHNGSTNMNSRLRGYAGCACQSWWLSFWAGKGCRLACRPSHLMTPGCVAMKGRQAAHSNPTAT